MAGVMKRKRRTAGTGTIPFFQLTEIVPGFSLIQTAEAVAFYWNDRVIKLTSRRIDGYAVERRQNCGKPGQGS